MSPEYLAPLSDCLLKFAWLTTPDRFCTFSLEIGRGKVIKVLICPVKNIQRSHSFRNPHVSWILIKAESSRNCHTRSIFKRKGQRFQCKKLPFQVDTSGKLNNKNVQQHILIFNLHENNNCLYYGESCPANDISPPPPSCITFQKMF